MLESFPVAALVGTVLGFLSGLGTGGGSLLILWLTLVLGCSTIDARMVNLLFFLPSALVACLFRRKQGMLPLKKILPGILASCTAALTCSLLSPHLEESWLQKAFGVLLVITGLRELFYRERKFK